ncbi:MAG TPA: styrene monooxygenase/indole monooxygenase family protein [Streptosporangiaceae bacterium]|nr:styrene monooxygenase/indole monooxygenase family protein [Streptosporangiaceae bacterium]
MARKILIVGAGQSGLQLAHGLLQSGYEVTLMSARTAEEIRAGRVMSTQAMFDAALQHERDLGINFWEDGTPSFQGISVSLAGPDGQRAINWTGRLDAYAQSVDQRVKMPGWMETFEQRGGRVIIHGVTVSDLDMLTARYDLTIVAAGKGELVNLFGRDPSRSPYAAPQRALSVVYVTGMTPRPETADLGAVNINLVPGVGELFVIPALTTTGPCDILFFEGIPDGPLDCWSDVRTPEEHLRRTLELMEKFVPWEYERARHVELTDWGGTLSGRYAPVVRYPVGRLPSGGTALGMADVVVANDPITGQGSNNASKCAAIYLKAIVDHGDRPYDAEFMKATFEAYWEYAQYPTTWTNAMLQPPPPHVVEILGAAGQHQRIADRFANGFNDPRDFFDWFMDPGKTAAYLAEVTGAAPGAKTA